MNVNDFMLDKMAEIKKDILPELSTDFNSHDLIAKISQKYQKEYVELVAKYNAKRGTGFQTVHGLMARFVSKKKAYFELEKMPNKVYSLNVFRNINKAQCWKKK